jgi:hypothetical protein
MDIVLCERMEENGRLNLKDKETPMIQHIGNLAVSVE